VVSFVVLCFCTLTSRRLPSVSFGFNYMTQWCMLVFKSSWLKLEPLRWDGNALNVLMPEHLDIIYIYSLYPMNVLNIWTPSLYLCYLLCCDVSWNYCMDNIYFNMLLLLFQNKLFFLRLTLFSVRMATQKITFNLGERNFSVSSPRPTEKKHVFSVCLLLFFVWINTYKK